MQQQAQPQPQPEPAPAPVQEQAPAPNPGATDSSYALPATSERVLAKSELESMSSYDLWIARNEIFARHGRMFNNADLQAYFNNKTWYTPTYTPEQWDATGQTVSAIESQNASLIMQVEQERNSEYL